MDKKTKRMHHTKELFITSAMKLIKKEGVKEISVRKVADDAGYSYATIYNYFEDMNHLLMCCIVRILKDCSNYIIVEEQNTKEKIKRTIHKYLEYMLDNTYAFDLLFIEDIGEIKPNSLTDEEQQEIMEPSVVKYISGLIKRYGQEQGKNQEEVAMIIEISSNYIFGKIAYTNRRMKEEPKEKTKNEIWETIEYIIK